MDRITKTLVDDFLRSEEIKTTNESKDFEKFVNYSIISQEYNQTFNVDDVTLNDGVYGIDGIGIVENGELVDTTDEIDDLISTNNYLEVSFVFTQAKTSSSFDSGDILNFCTAVKDFFSSQTDLSDESLKKFKILSEHVIKNAAYMLRGKPSCKLFYVTTGTWRSDERLMSIIELQKSELSSLSFFEKIDFFPFGANEIQKSYRETNQTYSVSFLFESKITLSDIPEIDQSYFGVLPFKEFLKIASDESGNLRSVYYDNVRDYQGDNPVNKKISGTLEQGEFDLFCVLNNGVTLVAKQLTTLGNQFTISDFQIVNGCQTTHVLFNNRHLVGIDKVVVPIRIIITTSDDIKQKVTVSTNRQTAIKEEQLESFTEFQKNLEHYYNSITDDGRLYYERRSKQYNTVGVVKNKIVTLQIQIKAFASIFLEVPHDCAGYYGKIVRNLAEKMFKPDHKFDPYYASALAYYRLENLFRTGEVESKFKAARYLLLMVFRILVIGLHVEQFGSKKIQTQAEILISKLNNKPECLETFQKSCLALTKSGMKIDYNDRSDIKSLDNTRKILESLRT